MVGRIYTDGGEAVMDDAGKWQSEDATLAVQLNALFGTDDYSPADGAFGHKQLHAAADRLGWKAEVEEKKPAPEGAVY